MFVPGVSPYLIRASAGSDPRCASFSRIATGTILKPAVERVFFSSFVVAQQITNPLRTTVTRNVVEVVILNHFPVLFGSENLPLESAQPIEPWNYTVFLGMLDRISCGVAWSNI